MAKAPEFKGSSYSKKIKLQAKILQDNIASGELHKTVGNNQKVVFDVWNDAPPADDGIEKPLKVLYEDNSYHIPAIMLKELTKGHMRFFNAFTAALENQGTDSVKRLPFVTCVPGSFSEVYVWDKLLVDPQFYGNAEALSTISFAHNRHVMTGTINAITEGRKPERAHGLREAYADNRLFRTLHKRTRMTHSKLLARCLGGMSSSTVRDMAQGIEENLKPIELVYATTKELLVEMYSTGPTSCMHPSSGSATEWRDVFTLDAIHPSFFYLHDPNLAPVFIRRNGKVSSRAILLKDKDGKYIGHATIYKESDKASTQMKTKLTEIGAGQGLSKGTGAIDGVLKIPGYWSASKKDYLCPMPYLDLYGSISSQLFVGFDIDEKAFYMAETPDSFNNITRNFKLFRSVIHNTKGTSGFLYAKRILGGTVCAACGVVIKDRAIVAVDGTNFCGAHHATLKGYIFAMDSAGHARCIPDAPDIIKDCTEYMLTSAEGHTTWRFTNLDAAKKNGCKLVTTRLGVPPGPLDYTRRDCRQLKYSGNAFSSDPLYITTDLYMQLRDNLIPGWQLQGSTVVQVGTDHEEILKKVNW